MSQVGRASRECVALEGGPRPREWYYEQDWTVRRQAATAMGRTAGDVEGWALGYSRTDRTAAHPTLPLVATIWVWAVPPQGTS